MKITMYNSDLKAAIDQITPIIPKKSSVPAMESVKIVAENNTIHVSGCDLERYLTVKVSGDVWEEGVCIVPLVNLKRLVNVPDHITLTSEGRTLTATNGKKKTQVEANVWDECNLPTFPEMENAVYLLDMNADALSSILENLSTFCSQNDNRPIMQGINFNFSAKRFEACNGFQLAVADMEWCYSSVHAESGSYVAHAIIADDLRKIVKHLTDREKASGIGVYGTEKYMQFSGAGFTYIIRRLEGDYFNPQSILDEVNDASMNVSVDVNDFISIAKEHASYFKRDERTAVALFVQNGNLHFYTDTPEIKTSDSLEYEGDVTGNADECFWFFNPKYMKEGLEIFDKHTTIDLRGVVNLGWKRDCRSSIGPMFMEGVGDCGIDYTYLMLPCHAKDTVDIPAIRKFCA